jgi:hypothetical protein
VRSGENSESDESESDEEKNAGMQRQRDREIDKDGSSCNRDFGDDLRPDVRPSACPRRFLAPKAGTKRSSAQRKQGGCCVVKVEGGPNPYVRNSTGTEGGLM